MTFWNEKSLVWYKQAAEYCNFHQQLAQKIMPYLDFEDQICDLGCGLGYLSLALAQHGYQVTAVDNDGRALDMLRQSIDSSDQGNIKILQADSDTLAEDQVWDVLILCFFGRLTEGDNLRNYLRHCRKRLISIVPGNLKSSISPAGVSRYTKEHMPQLAAFLTEQQVQYQLEEDVWEFGQPFDSISEALAFINHYGQNNSQRNAEIHIKEKLITLPNGGYYLPNQKQLGIFIIE
ncbi:MAG: class I SAM-dependent methyltransferase, partial [Clostridiales bacterium]